VRTSVYHQQPTRQRAKHHDKNGKSHEMSPFVGSLERR
jgi:hypothetical protein